MTRLAAIVAALVLLASAAAYAQPGKKPGSQRVVSLDFCADQYLLKLLPKTQILALSPDAEKDFSFLRDRAKGIPTVRPVAEDVLTLGPDLIVRSYGGGPNAAGFFERAGLRVLQIPFAGDLNEIRAAIAFIAEQLGVAEQGFDVIAEMDRRLQRIPTTTSQRTVLYMTPTGVTSGPGTMIHNMLRAAGLENFERQPGWRAIPLERLAYEQPDLVAASFFDAQAIRPSLWSAMRHPVAQRQMREQPTVMLPGALTSCGGWYLLDAIERLAAPVAEPVSP